MRIIGGPNPIFLNRFPTMPTIAPQVRSFDVFYNLPVVVGLHIMGDPAAASVAGFLVSGPDLNDAQIRGLFISEDQ